MKKGENGEESKKANEAFLLPAVSFTDAEARINKEIGQTADGEFLVHAMSLTEVQDIFRNDEGGQWYNCKITITYEDDDKVTKVKQNYMVEAMSVQAATLKVDEELKDAMFEYETTATSFSPIVDVFYQDLDREISRTPVETSAE